MRSPLTRVLLLLGAFGFLFLSGVGPVEGASSRASISGTGSGWSANAVNQWISDVSQNGLRVVYTASGSANGRKDFANSTTDFGVSEIGYQGRDPLTNARDDAKGRPYAYIPIVAGGTSFPYQIKIGGKQIRNLRLSGDTVAKIFTNNITNWNDPQITKDNNGRALPSLRIIPVVHSEGSGATAQFTRWLASQHSALWAAYSGSPKPTEYYPREGRMIAQNGSDGLMNFVTARAANGAIGMAEYSYALGKNYPVAKVLNKAGYYTLPSQYNVAVALTKAQINMDKTSENYLLQNLEKVYVASDIRTYPLSSYSYGILPTGGADVDQRLTTAKRQTLADFLFYSLCQGQKPIGKIGYSPLPVNLVQAGFEQTAKLKTADPGVDLTSRSVSDCQNPTFVKGQPNRNYLAEIAPKPPACDKIGAGPCADNSGKNVAAAASGNGTTNGSSSGTNKGTGTTTGTGTGTAAGTGATGTTGAAVGAAVDLVTGQVTGDGAVADQGGEAVAVSSELAGYRSTKLTAVLAPLAAILLLLAVVVPPIVGRRAAARREGGSA